MRRALLLGLVTFACRGDAPAPTSTDREAIARVQQIVDTTRKLEASRQELLLVEAEVLALTIEQETHRTSGTPAEQLTTMVALRARLMKSLDELLVLVASGATDDVRARATSLHARLRRQVSMLDGEVEWLTRMAVHDASR